MSAPRVLVVGDVMLDVMAVGTAERLSPEAPVAVLRNPRETRRLGGAGNSAANAGALGGAVVLVGGVGHDLAGEQVQALTAQRGVESALVVSADHATTTKTRWIAGSHHLLRVDHEDDAPGPWPVDPAAVAAMVQAWRADAVVIADYDKGFVTPALAEQLGQAARRLEVPLIVDTKAHDLTVHCGAWLMTPNLAEALAASGARDADSAADWYLSGVCRNLVLTMGAQGMLVATAQGRLRIPTHAQAVADVTGAGDTVCAALAVATAEGRSLVEAARWASVAAGVAVSRSGTHAVRRWEVDERLAQPDHGEPGEPGGPGGPGEPGEPG